MTGRQNSIKNVTTKGHHSRLDVTAISRLFDFVPGTLFYAKDRAGNWLACNQQTLFFLRASSVEDVKGKSEIDLFPQIIAAAVHEDDLRVLDDGDTIVDKLETLIDPQGALVWARTTKLPVRNQDGRIGALIGITRLISGEAALPSYPELVPVLGYLETHYRRKIEITALASMARLSPRQLRERFRKYIGLSPHQFIMRMRMQAAADLLRSGNTSIAQIALDCGFYDQNQFTRLFSAYFGTTPRRFRHR